MGEFDTDIDLQNAGALSVATTSPVGADPYFLSNSAIPNTDSHDYDLNNLFVTAWLTTGDLGEWQS